MKFNLPDGTKVEVLKTKVNNTTKYHFLTIAPFGKKDAFFWTPNDDNSSNIDPSTEDRPTHTQHTIINFFKQNYQ